MNFNRVISSWLFFGCASLYPSATDAQTINDAPRVNLPSRIVTTFGTGTVQAAPDKVYLTVGIGTWDKNLRTAYDLNEDKSRKLLALAPQFKIPAKNCQTSGISVEPTYPQNRSYEFSAARETPNGYSVDDTVIFVLDDVKDLRQLITKAVDAGANYIRSIQFDTSKLRQLKDEARDLALKAAREKAQEMAQVYGSKLGKAVIMQEVGTTIHGLSANDRYTFFPNSNNNIAVSRFAGSFETSESVAPGQLQITSSVTTTFELTE